ncbi:sugar transferase [Aliifodinibius sp. S!AR15-10]|uniref:sugar transferase n=1 Tax=Aliifodinibius sp. S!AR15-10 TaxID=2950437 RepID=UPI002854E2F1|nr:sugar transferase [Aliifodinibius sp. S!AR15-10]MDR8391312.1 sugar transferase [Aliifodinibius sp. S!AR15-10]
MQTISAIGDEKLSAREKIMLEKQLPYKSKHHLNGPSVDYFFHELKYEEGFLQRWVTRCFGGLLFLLNLLILPLISIGVLLSGASTMLQKEKRIGFRGHPIILWQFPTENESGESFSFGRFLDRSGLYKLPWSINMVKGELLLVGPKPLLEEDSLKWNNTYDEFYKRYATKPGFFVIGGPSAHSSEDQVEHILQKEFEYVLKPSIKKDFAIILGSSPA